MDDWKWQIQNRIRDLETLEKFVTLSEEEKDNFYRCRDFFEFSITPYYASLMDKNNPECPIRLQVIPRAAELTRSYGEVIDPLAEDSNMPVKGVTHRYPDRALWYLSHVCAVYCRFCTRKRKVSKSSSTPQKEDWEKALEYFKNHSEIREVILSGGDPLTLSDSQIDFLLSELKKISHINHIRIHTRYPVTLPQRFTEDLCSIFSKHYPIYLVTHFNHPIEITQFTKIASVRLHKIGNVFLLNQSVLLKGINDSAEILRDLNYKLIEIGIKPYYLHQCDDVFGSSHFKVPIENGKKIMESLRGFMSGITVPVYVADLTGGGGKVPIPTDYLVKENVEEYVFKNYKNNLYYRKK